ncbi:MAG: hypothetical protein WD929_01905 [Steroidobacteraceae bacterium]
MAGQRGKQSNPFVEVPLGSGAWAAARELGVDLSPAPSQREFERRQQLQQELAQALAAPLISKADL